MKALLRRIFHWLWGTPLARWRLTLVVLIGFAFLGGLAYGGWTRACAGAQCPSILTLTDFVPEQTSKVFAADGRLITEFGATVRTVISVNDMAPALRAAFVAVEDKRFYQHGGIDWVRFLGAWRANILARRWAEGFSTITMQLARNIFTDDITRQKLLRRKIREGRVAVEIENTFSKDRILELYLNQIHLGAGTNGVEAAAQLYLGKSARSANVAEAALLAALAQRPARDDPRFFPDRAVRRRNVVIGLMRDQGYLTPDEAAAWQAYPLILDGASESNSTAPYFVEQVRQEMERRFGRDLYYRGMNIYTTIDLDIQREAERVLEEHLVRIESDSSRGGEFYGPISYAEYAQIVGDEDLGDLGVSTPYLQGALVTIEAQTGYVRAMIGGRDFRDSKFNRATQAFRQVGSTFKPFVYSAAIRAGRPVSYMLNDSALSVFQERDSSWWRPLNFDQQYYGWMSARVALRRSRNVPTIRLGMELGESTVLGEARRYGITTRLLPFPSMHIGANDSYLLEMTAAFTAFANMGYRTSPIFVTRVEDRDGRILYESSVRQDEVMDPARMWLMVDMLRDVNSCRHFVAGSVNPRQRCGTGGAVAGVNLPSGGKTGTTDDGTDVWYIGFTRELVTGMWMGFDLKQRITQLSGGGTLVAPVWADLMRDIYSRRPNPGDWPVPEGLIIVDIDETTGFRHTAYCGTEVLRFERFIPGTEPVDFCPVHDPFLRRQITP